MPEPGPNEVPVKVEAAGLCHSDLHVIDWPEGTLAWQLPFTLGHETAGTVAAAGDGVTAFEEGDAVLVYGPWGCGTCWQCVRGSENLCPNRRSGRLRARLRRRARRLRARPVPAAACADRRPRPGSSRSADRRRAHVVSRDQARASAPASRIFRRRHRRRRTRSCRRSAPSPAFARADRGGRPARGGPSACAPRGSRRRARRGRRRSRGDGPGRRDPRARLRGLGRDAADAASVLAVGGHVSIVGLAGGTFPMAFGTLPLEWSAGKPSGCTKDAVLEGLPVPTQCRGWDPPPATSRGRPRLRYRRWLVGDRQLDPAGADQPLADPVRPRPETGEMVLVPDLATDLGTTTTTSPSGPSRSATT